MSRGWSCLFSDMPHMYAFSTTDFRLGSYSPAVAFRHIVIWVGDDLCGILASARPVMSTSRYFDSFLASSKLVWCLVADVEYAPDFGKGFGSRLTRG